MHIPEWEIEKILFHDPKILGFRPKEVHLVQSQKYLRNCGKFIDLLFKKGDTYVIVEIKSTDIKDESVIFDQLLVYKKNLASELHVPEDKITCMLVSPAGFSDNIKKICWEEGIIIKKLDKNKLINSLTKLTLKNSRSLLNLNNQLKLTRDLVHLLEKRGIKLSGASKTSLVLKNDDVTREIESIKTFLKRHEHDEHSKRKLANLMKKISEVAPIQAHEIGTQSQGKLLTNRDMWFWLFYSVMDRRANAALFIKAKEALEKKDLFSPHKIVALVKKKGEKAALIRIARILENSNFPLLIDRIMGKLAFPKSIVDAARFISAYDYDFLQLYNSYIEANGGDLVKARDALWKDLRRKIYGAGPRITSQIIRGLVLKGPWRFPLDDDRFLEKCRFNVWMAGRARLCLIKSDSEYYNKLGRFADEFLQGNRGIIAHVLWYIRKRYCTRPLKCNQCPVAGYCIYGYVSS